MTSTATPTLPHDAQRLENETPEKEAAVLQRPATGRTGALGRKVEKPGQTAPGGPSGQTEPADHGKRHANK